MTRELLEIMALPGIESEVKLATAIGELSTKSSWKFETMPLLQSLTEISLELSMEELSMEERFTRYNEFSVGAA